MRRRRLTPALTVGVTALLAPLLATPPAAAAPQPATATQAAEHGLDRYAQQKPRWKRCHADVPVEFQCATIKVPLDYRAPEGKQLDLAISRIRSTAPGKRHGVLLSNPGGPGGPGLYMPLSLQEMLPEKALASYDLIGFDPRGIGESSPVSCGLTPEEGDWLRPYKAETFDKDVAWARGVADKCREKAGDVLPHITTRNTARDMDLLRAVLGEKKVSYLGYSYGTYLGAVYTQMFPRRADRFVLDSAVDPALAWRGMVQWWAWGAEPAFDRWTGWAAARSDTYDLGTTPKQVDRTFWELVGQADEEPIVIDGQPLDGDAIRGGLRQAVHAPRYASEAVAELKKAAAGEPAAAKKLTPFTGAGRAAEARTTAEAPGDNATAGFFAVACGDNSAAWPRDPETYRREAIEDKGRHPLYGDFVSSVKPCAFWDASEEPATEVRNKVPSLIVQNEWDPQTPLPSGQALHADLKRSTMLTVLGGEGHGVYPSGNACTDGTVERYLLTGRLPARDVTCRATPESNAAARENQRPDTLPRAPLPERAPDRF
ncbi:alpha/beta hydrolase [Streptomyces sp. BBFR102]|uniref:alpha/beta hydrolase n=1 Tax=Streptomyces sp. BBFR102 TaxID=3448171 RepID=UPI003F5383FF